MGTGSGFRWSAFHRSRQRLTGGERELDRTLSNKRSPIFSSSLRKEMARTKLGRAVTYSLGGSNNGKLSEISLKEEFTSSLA